MVRIVGIGGTSSRNSSTECALRIALSAVAEAGGATRLFDGAFLTRLPHFDPEAAAGSPEAAELIQAVRSANGLILASPGYHGSISGLVKNAIDYLEETRGDPRPYLDGLPVGVIATAYGWQATVSTLAALRSVVHALRGWPTPFGAAVRSETGLFAADRCSDPGVQAQLQMVGRQVVDFARLRTRGPSAAGLEQEARLPSAEAG